MRRAFCVAAVLFCYTSAAQSASPDAPLPDAKQMKERLLKSLQRSEDALENYSCTVREQNDELNSDESVKKHQSSVKEQFFVNRIQVEHTLERNGKPLSVDEAKKEQERVDKEVRRFSNKAQAEKAEKHDERQADLFLRALQITNGRREQREGRSTLDYDLSGDPHFRPHKLEERFAQALTGKIALDEESETPVDLRFETKQDVKIGAGLLANLHKGFWLHLTQQRQPDGVWIMRELQGSGDARAALFLHARFRFQQQLEQCHLFSVDTQQKVHGPDTQVKP
ncbi:MAG: hypothetical protein M3Y24_06780 [Acidobacteriota bacterium]|nr:hypothetical protein [Acidobacteriota bacterium]